MGSEEERERHSRRRKRNVIAKILRDTGDMKGAFSLRIINPKKGTYKREKMNIRNIEKESGDEVE